MSWILIVLVNSMINANRVGIETSELKLAEVLCYTSVMPRDYTIAPLLL
jgi:hypothetical protein